MSDLVRELKTVRCQIIGKGTSWDGPIETATITLRPLFPVPEDERWTLEMRGDRPDWDPPMGSYLTIGDKLGTEREELRRILAAVTDAWLQLPLRHNMSGMTEPIKQAVEWLRTHPAVGG